ncbi:MAG: hypothetical protein VX061_10750 [Pseudomonadota bacterium]|nr:hypothetical protein [Pseudomonadota bacterium]
MKIAFKSRLMISLTSVVALLTLSVTGCTNNTSVTNASSEPLPKDVATITTAYTAYKSQPNAETAFAYLFDVATSPRCVNCHGVVENGAHRPTVGDNRTHHPMNITSINNLKMAVQDGKFVQVGETNPVNCRGCHQDKNADEPGRPPGAANDLMPGFVWHMPPPTMIIARDVTPLQLCNNWLNPQINSFLAQRGGRNDMKTFKKEFEHHVKDDPLVRWAWAPGPGRTPAPGTHEDFGNAMTLWIDAGAPCPSQS